MMYRFCGMKQDIHNFLSFWIIFCPSTPLRTPKIKIKEKMEKMPADIILRNCTINDNHMMHGS